MNLRFRGKSGHTNVLNSMTESDPERKSRRAIVRIAATLTPQFVDFPPLENIWVKYDFSASRSGG
jgi:hypothetical protein